MAEPQRSDNNDTDLRNRLRGSAYYSERTPKPYVALRRINDFQHIHNVSTPKAPPKLAQNSAVSSLAPSISDFSSAKKITTKVTLPIRSPTTAKPAQPRMNRSKVLRRQQLKISKPKRKLHITRSTIMLWSMAVIIFIVGIVVSLLSLHTNQTAVAQVTQLTQKSEDGVAGGTNVPSETSPKGDISAYQVAPELPRFISIPKFGVKSRVLRLGVKPNNELSVPGSIFDAGWYDGSSKPGEAGAMLIDGHVSGPTKLGVFGNLKNLKPGDMIEITRGDGQVFKYKMVKSQSYSASQTDMVAALKPVEGKRGLNLITCGGKFDTQKQAFEDRLVIFTTQVE